MSHKPRPIAKPRFSKEQLEYLKQCARKPNLSPETSYQEFMFAAGFEAAIKLVESRVPEEDTWHN